jgi:OOP family OmpA-OmpF porin
VDSGLSKPVVLQSEPSKKVIKIKQVEPRPKEQGEQVVAPAVSLEPKKLILELQPNSLKLTSGGQKALDSFVEKLKLYSRATVVVKGFVAATSNSPANIELSEERAMSVQRLMLAKGVDPARIKVVGMGNQEPIASNNTSEGRKKNRRVELVVTNDGS